MPVQRIDFPKGEDASTCVGAGILAETIESYWHARGHDTVKAQRFEVWLGSGLNTWQVRSNLVAGKPAPKPRFDAFRL
jgi:hypothetical protein